MFKVFFYFNTLWNDLTISWNELTIFWNELTILWNEVTWNEMTMERNDRIPDGVFSLRPTYGRAVLGTILE